MQYLLLTGGRVLHQRDEDFLAAYQASYGVSQPETTPTDNTQNTCSDHRTKYEYSTEMETKNNNTKVHVHVHVYVHE